MLILKNLTQYLFLASGAKNGEGFWIVGVKNSDESILDDANLLDCHRKELIGNESAREVLFAINFNITNLINELENQNYLIDKPSIGISFSIPLDVIGNIFDFWLEAYKRKEDWETCLGLLKIRRKISLTNLIKSKSLKGNSRKFALKIENLHCYMPNTSRSENTNEPMWK